MASADANADLLATTLDNYRGKLVDNVFNKHVLSWLLMDKNRTRMDAGGEKIVEHIQSGTNGDTTEYTEWQSVPITPQGFIDVAEYDWKMLMSTIAISGLEEFKNQGEERIINLLKARIKNSESSLQKMVNDQLWGVDATGFNSVLDLIDDTFDAGGIDCSVETWWQSPTRNLSAAATSATDAGEFSELLRELTTSYNNASDGNDFVTALVGDQATHEVYELGLTPQVRYTDKKSASLGFQNVAFKGVPFYWDKAAPAGTVIGVNPSSLTLVGGKGKWFKQSGFTTNPIDQDTGGATGDANFRDARYAVIVAYGNVTINERRKCFKVYNFGAA